MVVFLRMRGENCPKRRNHLFMKLEAEDNGI